MAEDLTGLILQAIASAAEARKNAARAAASPGQPVQIVPRSAADAAAARMAQARAQPVPSSPGAAGARSPGPASGAAPKAAWPRPPAPRPEPLDDEQPPARLALTDFRDPRALVAAIVVAEALDRPLALRRREWP